MDDFWPCNRMELTKKDAVYHNGSISDLSYSQEQDENSQIKTRSVLLRAAILVSGK